MVCGTHLRLLAPWTTGCFRSECCTGGEPMAAPRVNRFLAPIHQRRARGWTGGKHCFSQLRYNPTGNRTLPSRFGRTLPTRFGRTLPTRFGRTLPTRFGRTLPTRFGGGCSTNCGKFVVSLNYLRIAWVSSMLT